MIILYIPRAAESKQRLPISVRSLAAVFEGKYPWRCQELRTLGTWRYNLGVFGFPVEQRAVFKYISYRRPEPEGL